MKPLFYMDTDGSKHGHRDTVMIRAESPRENRMKEMKESYRQRFLVIQRTLHNLAERKLQLVGPFRYEERYRKMPQRKLQFVDHLRHEERYLKMSMVNKINVHIALIVQHGRILAEATNKEGTRSRGSGYSTLTIHAERNVVKQLGNIERLRDADLYVMRCGTGDNAGKFMPSKPCPECECFLYKCMRKYGLRNVYYT